MEECYSERDSTARSGSDLMRKRKVDCNPPPKAKRRARGEGSSELKTVSARERVKQFPDECLTVTGRELGNFSVMRVVRNLVYGETSWQIISSRTSIFIKSGEESLL